MSSPLPPQTTRIAAIDCVRVGWRNWYEQKSVLKQNWGGGVFKNPSERTSEENCEGADRPSWGRVWENFAFWAWKTVSDGYFGQRFLEYDFLQIPRGKTITSSFEHAVSDTFILIISERAPLEISYISMSPKVIGEGAKRPSGGRVWEGVVPPPRAGKFLHLEPEKKTSFWYMYLGQRLLAYDFLQIARGQDDNIELWACRFRYIYLNN